MSGQARDPAERFLQALDEWAARYEAVAQRRDKLALLATVLEAKPPGRDIDAILRYQSGYVAVNGLAHNLILTMDSHGPAVAGEGDGGEFTLLIHDIQDITPDRRAGGVNIWLETGESFWLGRF